MDAREDVLEPHTGVNTVLFACVDEGVDHGDTLSRLVASCKEVVFPADGDRPNGIFHQVVVYFQPAVEEEAFQIFLSFEGVGDCAVSHRPTPYFAFLPEILPLRLRATVPYRQVDLVASNFVAGVH